MVDTYSLGVFFLRDQEVTIATYYAPNTEQIPFLTHLLQVLPRHRWGILIIGRDSNLTIKPHQDRSPTLLKSRLKGLLTFWVLIPWEIVGGKSI